MEGQNHPTTPNSGNAPGHTHTPTTQAPIGGKINPIKGKNHQGNKEALVDDNDENYDSDAGYLSPQSGEGVEDKNEISGMGNSKFKPKKGKVSP